MLRSLLLLIFVLLTAIQCKEQNGEETKSSLSDESPVADTSQEARSSDEIKLLQSIAEAHRKEAFLDKKAVVFDIDLNFGGEDRLDATVSMLTDGSAIRIDKTDGRSLVFDGSQVYLSPENADASGARFAIFTWPYFFAFPYKLEDPGTNFEYLGKLNLNGNQREAFKLSFEPGTGDAPDDWYLAYLNPDNTIHAAAYIVTYGNTPQE